MLGTGPFWDLIKSTTFFYQLLRKLIFSLDDVQLVYILYIRGKTTSKISIAHPVVILVFQINSLKLSNFGGENVKQAQNSKLQGKICLWVYSTYSLEGYYT